VLSIAALVPVFLAADGLRQQASAQRWVDTKNWPDDCQLASYWRACARDNGPSGPGDGDGMMFGFGSGSGSSHHRNH
jgi:hypothetical protein